MNSIEQLWESLLSRDSERIQITFTHLNEIEQKAVIDHLLKMTTEGGWHSDQKHSAQIALGTINSLNERKK